MRSRALTLSSAVILIYVFFHIWCVIDGTKTLILPDFVWVVIFAPWVGEGIAKFSNIDTKFIGKKPD